MALAKVGGGGWSGEDAETSLKKQSLAVCGPLGPACPSDFSHAVTSS